MTRQTIRLEDFLARRVKVACAKSGETISEFYRRATLNEFAKMKAKTTTTK